MKGTRISEKTYDLIKGMLSQGYSAKKIEQLMPDEIKVCLNTIYRVDKSSDYDDYCGVKKEPEEPQKAIQITPYAQTKEIVEAINRTNILLESMFQLLKELFEELK